MAPEHPKPKHARHGAIMLSRDMRDDPAVQALPQATRATLFDLLLWAVYKPDNDLRGSLCREDGTPYTVTELAEWTGIGRVATRKHLAELTAAGFLATDAGRTTILRYNEFDGRHHGLPGEVVDDRPPADAQLPGLPSDEVVDQRPPTGRSSTRQPAESGRSSTRQVVDQRPPHETPEDTCDDHSNPTAPLPPASSFPSPEAYFAAVASHARERSRVQEDVKEKHQVYVPSDVPGEPPTHTPAREDNGTLDPLSSPSTSTPNTPGHDLDLAGALARTLKGNNDTFLDIWLTGTQALLDRGDLSEELAIHTLNSLPPNSLTDVYPAAYWSPHMSPTSHHNPAKHEQARDFIERHKEELLAMPDINDRGVWRVSIGLLNTDIAPYLRQALAEKWYEWHKQPDQATIEEPTDTLDDPFEDDNT